MRRFSTLFAAAALTLSACGLPTADKESDAEARQLYQEIHSGADLSQDPNLDETMKTPDRLAELAAVRAALPQGEPSKIENRAWNYNTTNDGALATLVHAYIYPDRTVMTETVLRKASGEKTWRIAGFKVKLDPAASGGNAAPASETPGEKT